MATYFTPATFRVLRELAKNNERAWFDANRERYEAAVKRPFLRLIADLQPGLAKISPHFVADPRGNGGSLFRIHRDTRFSKDKTPYKTHAGAKFFHERSRQAPAPVFYLHVEPGACFLGGGWWHPEPEQQRRIRQFILDNPEGWRKAVHGAAFRKRFALGGDALARPPRGIPADHPLVGDLKRKDFVASMPMADADLCSATLLKTVLTGFTGIAPLVDYLCAAVELEF